MAFLVPALAALVSDSVALWLYHHLLLYQKEQQNAAEEEHSQHNSHWCWSPSSALCFPGVSYLAALAGLRIALLLLPLLFHSYSGTALRFVALYQLLYGGTLVLLAIHATVLVASWEPPRPGFSWLFETSLSSSEPRQELVLVGWMLLASLVSDSCHWILLWHVRSTADYANTAILYGPYRRKRRDHKSTLPTVYFVMRHGEQLVSSTPPPPTAPSVDDDDNGNLEVARNNSISLSSQTGYHSLIPFNGPPANQRLGGGGYYQGGPDDDEPALVHAMSEFVVELKTKLQRAKVDWTHRLDDFSDRVSEMGHHNNNSNQDRRGGLGTPASSTKHHLQSRMHSEITPFRVLLQLFAYEDVLENGRLSAAWDADDGEGLTFFVPQLLSFLLHGALYCSPQLEAWILERCRESPHFAHRCYWFLRAWCLEAPLMFHDSALSLDQPQQQHQLQQHLPQSLTRPTLSRNNSDRSLSSSSGLAAFLDSENRSTNNVGIGTVNPTASAPGAPRSVAESIEDKFCLPEERELIERLMLRVKECGEVPAHLLEFGYPRPLNSNETLAAGIEKYEVDKDLAARDEQRMENNGVENARDILNSPTALKNAVDSGVIPTDPTSGCPSSKHMDSLTAANKYGFLPVLQQPQSLSSPRCRETEYFDKSPRFLDALVFLAEALFAVPRAQRQEELRQSLRALECELLPSNSVYVPIGNMYHRVWRIVADECVAISTKERVPCIICLEVVDYTPYVEKKDPWAGFAGFFDRLPKRSPQSESGRASPDLFPGMCRESPLTSPMSSSNFTFQTFDPSESESEKEMVREWQHGHRDPLRRTSLLDKMTTKMGAGPLLDKMAIDMLHRLGDTRSSSLTGASDDELRSLTAAIEPNFHAAEEARRHHQRDRGPDGSGNNRNSSVLHLNADLRREAAAFDRIAGTAISGGGANTPPSLSLSRSNSDSSLVSMGQWSTPNPSTSRSIVGSRGPVPPVSAKMNRDISSGSRFSFSDDHKLETRKLPNQDLEKGENTSSGGCVLPYGSDHEEETASVSVSSGSKVRRGSLNNGAPPSQQQKRKPPLAKRRSSQKSLSSLNSNEIPGDGQANTSTAVKSRKPPVVFRESWQAKQERVRKQSAYGTHPGWRLLPILIKANDDLRQEQLASQIIYRMASILARERVPVWLCPYEILALTDTAGIIEAIPDTISLDSLKKNDPNFTSLRDFFYSHFGDGSENNTEELADAKANFVESLAAYSIVSFLLQIKDRHNGNILLDSRGHLIHIDFGFFFLSSPGKNAGFESAPWKLTREFIEVLDGPESRLFRVYRELCVRSFLVLRKHCMEIILMVEMLKSGNEELECFRGRPDDAIQQLRDRFCLNLNDRACREYVNSLVDDSVGNWRTDWYDRYQKYFVGVL